MNVMVTGLHGGKMSSSHSAETKIEFLDDAETVRRKIDQISCEEGDGKNPVLLILRDVIFPISLQRAESLAHEGATWEADPHNKPRPFITQDAPQGTVFSIAGGEGGIPRHYTSFDHLQDDFVRGDISTEALKAAVVGAFQALLDPIRAIYRDSQEWQAVDKLAYAD